MLKPLLTVALLLLAAAPAAALDMLKPKALRKGDTIALVAPARGTDAEKVAELTKGLEAAGYKVKPAANVTAKFGYLGGTDEERAAGFMTAWNDPEVDALFCVAGGYGVTRILDRLDYEAIRKQPKILVGFSDITGLHLAITKRAGVITFHGPTTTYAFLNDKVQRPIQAEYLWRAISADSYKPGTTGYLIPSQPTPRGILVRPGKASGRLIGGNMSLVAATMGTPYEVDTKGAILFLEETNEEPYRIDRFLSQLQLGGKLDGVSGVVLGQFNKCVGEDFTVEDLWQQYFANKPYPVVRDFPTGHVIDNATLPEGAMAELDAAAGTVRLLEDPVLLK